MLLANFNTIPATAAPPIVGVASPSDNQPSTKLAQADDPARLEQQREAERVLKEAENLRRETRDSGSRDLERRTERELVNIRENGRDARKVRESQTEIRRIERAQDRRKYNYYPYNGSYSRPYNYNPYNGSYSYPYIVAPTIIEVNELPPRIEGVTQYSTNQYDSTTNPYSSKLSVSAGFKDGKINPAIGYRFGNFGVELGALFNQDNLSGNLNDYAIPSTFLFNDLGVKKLSGQYGGDILGHFDVSKSVSLYGGVGVYFQSTGNVAQSRATNELYKQTNQTEVTPAVSGGVDFNASDSFSVGVGYHSLRGVTGKVGFSF